jgi:hypothetical protein
VHNTPKQTTIGIMLTLATGPFKQLIIGCLTTMERHDHAMNTLRSYVSVIPGGPRRCGLFKIDESRPCPPSVRGRKNDAGDALVEKWKGRNFCFVRLNHPTSGTTVDLATNLHPSQFEYSDPDVDTSGATPSCAQRYTLLRTFGDFSKTPL